MNTKLLNPLVAWRDPVAGVYDSHYTVTHSTIAFRCLAHHTEFANVKVRLQDCRRLLGVFSGNLPASCNDVRINNRTAPHAYLSHAWTSFAQEISHSCSMHTQKSGSTAAPPKSGLVKDNASVCLQPKGNLPNRTIVPFYTICRHKISLRWKIGQSFPRHLHWPIVLYLRYFNPCPYLSDLQSLNPDLATWKWYSPAPPLPVHSVHQSNQPT